MFAAVLSMLVLVASGDAATSAGSGEIYFLGSRATDFFPEVSSVAADGSDRRDLTNSPEAEEWPAPSPDGKQIAFVRVVDGYDEIYVMNADGSDAHRVCPAPSLPSGGCVASEPQSAIAVMTWWPDGRTLGFLATEANDWSRAPGYGEYVIDLADGTVRKVETNRPVFSPDRHFAAWTTAWPPQGCWHDCAPPEVVIVRTDRWARVGHVSRASFVAWAPRGDRFLYERWVGWDEGGTQVATSDAFGRQRRALAPASDWQIGPVWSANGRRVLFFRSTAPGSHNPCLVDGLDAVADAPHAPIRRLVRLCVDVETSARSPDGNWIAFGGEKDLYLVRTNGSSLMPISGMPGFASSSPLAWSADSRHLAVLGSDGVVRVVSLPQRTAVAVTTALDHDLRAVTWAGDRLVFASDNPRTHLFAVQADGSGLRQLAPDTAPAGQISPDGTRIVFARDSSIWTARIDGSDERRIAQSDSCNAVPGFGQPVWSPDGTQIAFVRQENSICNLFVVGASGGPVEQVTQSGVGPLVLAWSPDANWIAVGPLLVHPDGTGLHLLRAPSDLRCFYNLYTVSWSPDSTRLAFGDFGDPTGPNNGLCISNVDGSGFRQLTTPPTLGNSKPAVGSSDSQPAWAPDGTTIVFVRSSIRGARIERNLWTINADGSGEKQLTAGPWPDTQPTWLPGARAIAR